MSYSIRMAKESDFPKIIELFHEFAAFEKAPEKMLNTIERLTEEQEFFNCFVAEHDGKIVGYVTHFFCFPTWIGKSLYMDDLYIQPEHRKNGLGSLLINKIIDYAKESNCHKVQWQVSEWNSNAIRFYKSLGAEINETERNCDLILG